MKRIIVLLALVACGKSTSTINNATAGAPNAPAGLTVTAGNAETILAWQASPSATSYTVQRSATKGGPYTTLAFTAQLTYTDSGLANGTAMFYVVGAANGALASAGLSEATATPLASAGAAPPAVPSGLTATAGSGAQVTLSWTGVSAASGYALFRSSVSGGPYTALATTNSTSFTDTTAVSGTSYFYVARASAGTEQSANSAEVAFATSGAAPPPAPTGLSAVSSSTQVALSWNASASATAYVVLRGAASGGPYKSVATPTATSFTDKVSTGTYFYVVAATKGGATSENSSQVEATVSAPTSSGWLVGDGGSMLSITTNGLIAPHAAVTHARLNSLTCVGIHAAWAVGDNGTILYTGNGGASWSTQTSHTAGALRSVSFSTLLHGVVVGDSGTILITDDGGVTWSTEALAPGLASIDFQAAKLSEGGTEGAVVGSAGSLLVTGNGGASWVSLATATAATIYGVDLRDAATPAIAVGASGSAYSFTGTTVTPLNWETSTTFYAARLLPNGGAIAVGASGTIVRSALSSGAPTALASGTTEDLYAVLVSDADDGGGLLAAGAAGTLISATAVDAPFVSLSSGTSENLRSIDDLPPL